MVSPSCSWIGTPPSRPGMGLPPFHQQDRVPPIWTWDEYPSPINRMRVLPPPVWAWDGIPPSRPGLGYPPPLSAVWSIPPIQTWDGATPPPHQQDGVPPIWTWDEYNSPISRMRVLLPPSLGLGWGTPIQTPDSSLEYPPIQTWDGVLPPSRPGIPPPPPARVNRLKILPSLILRMRAVIRYLYEPPMNDSVYNTSCNTKFFK